VRAFLDTNVLVYAFSQDERAERARSLLDGNVVGVQCLNEFINVALKKLRLSWSAIAFALDRIERLCEIEPTIDLALHRTGMGLAQRYRVTIYDGLILAAALRAGCDILWSEDMQDGLVVEKALTVRNPFLA
jgi:predicted nucleic acid-binding protein